MSEIQIKQGNNIYEKDNSVTMISLIIEGTVSVNFPNDSFRLSAGDVIGVLDLYTNVHSCTYTAESDIVVDSYPYKNLGSLHHILQEEPDFYPDFLRSALKQFFAVSDFCTRKTQTCDTLYSTLMEYHRDYTMLCKQYNFPTKMLPGLENVQPFVPETKPEEHLPSYYGDLLKMCEDRSSRSILFKPGFLSGFLLSISRDTHQYLNTCEEMSDYLFQLSHFLMNEEKIDLFDLYVSLLTHASHKNEDTVPLLSAISKILIRTRSIASIPSLLYQQRLLEYRTLTQQLENLSASASQENTSNAHTSQVEGMLKNSSTQLLSFADMDEDFCQEFLGHLDAYKKIVDKTSVSSEISALRTNLTRQFFELYKNVFFYSIQHSSIPEVVRMFLYFGYVDEDLCGIENAIQLFDLLPTYQSDHQHQIYLFYDWLKLIYNNEKQPRRDEFDQDYPAHIQTMVNDGKLSKAEASELLHDTMHKVEFELDNMFTTAVKMTYGRLQTYCPILSEHDFMKSPTECLLRPQKIQTVFEEIRSIDFSAFHREVMFSSPLLSNGRELVQREILPDIILLPNIGIRAALWQEIEGRNRSTPGCMLFPSFCLTDPKHLALRLTGEFRWEMCKRMQGSRWNDVSNLSLTSEYFDYLQFYKKNKDLSPEAKEKCRQQLTRVKNRFRECFILDYISWITYEAQGTPHMNKVTRKIFMTYCPLSQSYREALAKNPFYSAMIEKYNNQKEKELKRMTGITLRIKRIGKPVPLEIQNQLAFLQK
ncbi:MAG: hypothetical protein J6B19_03550 [Lachnospiraceae bacterium]|nr:hypothetical protein [Lachnospiraceae bacterium]